MKTQEISRTNEIEVSNDGQDLSFAEAEAAVMEAVSEDYKIVSGRRMNYDVIRLTVEPIVPVSVRSIR